ncbi:glycosyltransferase, partial [Photobacterium phosphoreum]|uniref:glycosyltransferase n=1 Tax=Photobacterium phosphoreum TaxID=659 RepID=UPI000D4A3C58
LKIWNSIDEDLRDGWLLKIVGCGELDGDLRDYINHNELESTVKLVEPCNNIESIYKSASIFALSSRSEGFGMVLLEAAGFGIPLIAFNCPSGPRDIINKSNGYLIDIDDCQSYRYELIRMMNDEKLLMSLSLGSVQTFNQWSDENISKIWLDILK